MNKIKDDNIEKYISPILKSKTVYDLLEDMKYKIEVLEPDSIYSTEVDVVNEKDVLGLIITAQIEASVIFMEHMLNDNSIVMTHELEKSFKDYVNDLRYTIENENIVDSYE